MGCRIAKVDYYLPEKVLTNEELAKASGRWSAEKIEKKVGIRLRHIAGENETALDMAYEASVKVLAGVDRDKIDFVLLCTQSPDYFLPTSACILQDRLGLRTGIGALDFNLGCSGYIYGLAMAKGLINSGIATTVLLVVSETYSRFIHEKDFSNRTIFGDGAAASLIEKTDRDSILEFVLGTDGKGWDNLVVPYGGLRHGVDPDARPVADESGNLRTPNNLYMNGTEIFNFTIEAVPKAVEAVLQKNRLEMENLDYFIFHQANRYMINYLRKKIKIPPEKFFEDMLDTGNTVSATIPIALAKTLAQEVVKPGYTVLLCGFGVGYSWGAVIIKI
jgi:3-oxoacyl-[acyl-carrier-protein] synthase III